MAGVLYSGGQPQGFFKLVEGQGVFFSRGWGQGGLNLQLLVPFTFKFPLFL